MSSSGQSVADPPSVAEPHLAAADRGELAEAARAFARDVLPREHDDAVCSTMTRQGWRRNARARKIERDGDWSSAVLEHVLGDATYAVCPLHRAVVIDIDHPDYRDKTTEAPRDEKLRAAKDVSLVLDTFGIPHLHVDSRGGFHTWVRLEEDPRPEVLNALSASAAMSTTRSMSAECTTSPANPWALRVRSSLGSLRLATGGLPGRKSSRSKKEPPTTIASGRERSSDCGGDTMKITRLPAHLAPAAARARLREHDQAASVTLREGDATEER
jgi:hypothetical protein